MVRSCLRRNKFELGCKKKVIGPSCAVACCLDVATVNETSRGTRAFYYMECGDRIVYEYVIYYTGIHVYINIIFTYKIP